MNEENTSEIENTSEETSEGTSEETSEGTSEETSEGSSVDYSSILEEMKTELSSTQESTSELAENLHATNDRLDLCVTFLLVFGILAFIIICWRILYGWFYKSV